MRSAALRFSAFVLVVAASTTPAATYYVATNGNDADPGTLAQPWKTLQHAADRVAPGDTVEVRAGDFAGASFATSGTATRQIVVEAYAGESPSITADNPKTPDGIKARAAAMAAFMAAGGNRDVGTVPPPPAQPAPATEPAKTP